MSALQAAGLCPGKTLAFRFNTLRQSLVHRNQHKKQKPDASSKHLKNILLSGKKVAGDSCSRCIMNVVGLV